MPDSRASGSSFKDLPLRTSSKLSTKERNQGESSSDGGTGKKLSAAGALLKDKHPELFLVAPRPGGFIKNIGSPLRDPWKTDPKKEGKGRTASAITGNEARPVSMSEVLETRIPCPAFHKLSKDEERNNTVRMCSIAIGTVMMLAQHTYKDISVEQVKHTEVYFKALRQADGYPQNIGQLMQVIANLKRSGKIVTPPPDEEDSDDKELEGHEKEDEDVQISDIIN